MGKISDEAVKSKTGRTKAQWYSVLDKAGAHKRPHKEIATLLYEKHKLDGWWAQMVSVEYEHARGLRGKLQTCAGDFAGCTSRVIAVGLATLYREWEEEALRGRWEVTTATKNKSMRVSWKDGSRVSFYFYVKGAGRSCIAVDHMKLPDTTAAERMKKHWTAALDKLKERLEK